MVMPFRMATAQLFEQLIFVQSIFIQEVFEREKGLANKLKLNLVFYTSLCSLLDFGPISREFDVIVLLFGFL
jgi:hypothetical protein